jgi:hypothetical protein
MKSRKEEKRTNCEEKGKCRGQVERRRESEEDKIETRKESVGDKWRGEGKVKRTK